MRIGIDLGGTKIEGILMDREGNVTQVIRKAAPRGSYERTVQAIAALVHELDILAVDTCPVGIATPGIWIPDRWGGRHGYRSGGDGGCHFSRNLDSRTVGYEKL